MTQVLKRTLIGFDRYTIYKVHIKDQNRVIPVKNLQIFEDYKAKKSTKLLDYSKSQTTFQRFFHINNNDKKQELPVSRAGWKAKNAKEEE